MKIWDISPLIHEKMATFPGDKSFARHVSMDFSRGDHLTLSSIESTLHIGAHADASNHYHKEGKGIEDRDLSLYLGPCQVIQVKIPPGERIKPEHLTGVKIETTRILFRTDSFLDPNAWKNNFNSLSPELVEMLSAKYQIKLVGIDTPSVDPADSKSLETHSAIYACDMAILEGIILSQVPPGVYTLIALPLRIKNADASPVRAILLNKDQVL